MNRSHRTSPRPGRGAPVGCINSARPAESASFQEESASRAVRRRTLTYPLEPEAPVYAPGENGKLKLAAVEYVVRGPNSNPPRGFPAADPDRAGNGDAHPGPTSRASLLPHACLGLEAQPGRDFRGLESRGHLPLEPRPSRRGAPKQARRTDA